MTKSAGKAAKEANDTATIAYHVGKDAREAELHLPVAHGRGEALLNRVESEGCTDLQAVRDQIRELPHVNAEDEPTA
jgi:hypothetical protein